MTHDTSKIGILQQILWFYSIYRKWQKTSKAKAYLAYYLVGGQYEVVVGYGLIRDLRSQPVLSGGLSGKYRGMGFGEQLFDFLLKQGGKKTVVLDVLENNFPAMSLYKKLGFKETHRRKGIVYMKYE
jgi:ribosomal protein S18 acetylase RimI-like enzyme